MFFDSAQSFGKRAEATAGRVLPALKQLMAADGQLAGKKSMCVGRGWRKGATCALS